jgi:hypothetical protein
MSKKLIPSLPLLALSILLVQAVSVYGRLAPEIPAFWMSNAEDSRLTIVTGGGFTSLEIDTTRVDAHGALQYGLSEQFSFSLIFPYRMETHLNDSKAGQRDLIAGLSYRHQLREHLWIGLSESVSVTSAFKTELEGFGDWGHPVPQYETRLHLGGRTLRSPLVHNLHFQLNTGVRTDAHLENTVLQWDGQFHLDFWKNRLRITTEFGQEMRTDNKDFTHQLGASFSAALPWNFRLGFGVVQTSYRDLTPFGAQFSLGWTHQKQPVVLRTRHRLLPALSTILDEKNRVPVFTLEPRESESESLADAGRLPFRPLDVAFLPVPGNSTDIVDDRFVESLSTEVSEDTLIHVLSHKKIQSAYENLRIMPDQTIDEQTLIQLASILDADVLVQSLDVNRSVVLDQKKFLLLRNSRLSAEFNSRVRVFIPGATGFLPLRAMTWTDVGPSNYMWRSADNLSRNPIHQASLEASLLERATKELRHDLFYHTEIVQEDPK